MLARSILMGLSGGENMFKDMFSRLDTMHESVKTDGRQSTF